MIIDWVSMGILVSNCSCLNGSSTTFSASSAFRLRSEAISFVAGPGRGPAKLVDIIRACELDGGRHNRKRWEKIASTTTAKALDVSQIEKTTPLTSGSVKPEHRLLGGRAAELLDFRARVLDPQPPASTVPRGCYMVSAENEPALREFLLDRGMASLVRESDVECDSSGKPLLAGFFGVPHRNGLRMICNRRPQNYGEARLHWAHSPLGGAVHSSRHPARVDPPGVR